jgi:hypothetical protein
MKPDEGKAKEASSMLPDHAAGIFQAVAARQLHYNSQTWQVPVLSLTAQAFLFSISLDSSSTRAARLVASLLTLTTTAASMQLMARHRNGDIHDAHWLAAFERKHLGDSWVVHGPTFRQSRDEHVGGGPLARMGTSFVWWMAALALFGVAALATIVIELAAPAWLG